jgi:Flp pilus assembly CpaF family ATPase
MSRIPNVLIGGRPFAELYPNWERTLQYFEYAIHQQITPDPQTGTALTPHKYLSEDQAFKQFFTRQVRERRELEIELNQIEDIWMYAYDEFFGMGLMRKWLDDPEVEDIIMDSWHHVDVTRKGVKYSEPSPFRDDEDAKRWMQRMLSRSKKELHENNPVENGRLPDGSRVIFLIPPVTQTAGFAIRKHRQERFQRETYEQSGVAPAAFFDDLQSWIATRKNLLMCGATGSGKAQPLDARIATPEGWTTMGSLAVGDQILGADGKAHRVQGVYPQGAAPVFELLFSDGARTRCCGDHLWRARTLDAQLVDGPWETLDTETMQERLESDGETWFVPVSAPVEFAAGPALPIEARQVGRLFARLGLESLPEQLETRLSELHDGDGVRAHGLPTAYLRASVADRVALLEGLLEAASDGSDSALRLADRDLAAQTVELVRSLGGVARLATGPNAGWTVTLQLPAALNGHSGEPAPARSLVSVTAVGREQTQCIRVSAPDSLYLTDDYLVTHNTTLINYAASLIDPADRVLVIEDTPELQIPHPRVYTMAAMLKGAREGNNDEWAITIRDLVKHSLRMKPDRIIIGEVRGGEAYDMLDAMNTGHDGGMTTLHANSPTEAILRLESLTAPVNPNMPLSALQDLIGATIGIVIQMKQMPKTSRRVVVEASQIFHPSQTIDPGALEAPTRAIREGRVYLRPLWLWNPETQALERVGDPVPMHGQYFG